MWKLGISSSSTLSPFSGWFYTSWTLQALTFQSLLVISEPGHKEGGLEGIQGQHPSGCIDAEWPKGWQHLQGKVTLKLAQILQTLLCINIWFSVLSHISVLWFPHEETMWILKVVAPMRNAAQSVMDVTVMATPACLKACPILWRSSSWRSCWVKYVLHT